MPGIAFYVLIGNISLLVIGLFILLIIKFAKRKPLSFKGRIIENEIPDNITKDLLERKIAGFYREGKYQHAVIYLFYLLRLFCKENLVVRNAKMIHYKELKKALLGIVDFSQLEYDKFLGIYEKARFTKEAVTRDDFVRFKSIYTGISGQSF